MSNEYRKEIFKEKQQYINNIKDINDIMILEDFSQNIGLRKIQQCFIEIRVKDIY